MTAIPPIAPAGPAPAPSRAAPAAGGFRLPAGAEPAASAPPAAASSLGPLLALQEAALPQGLAGARERQARRHGAALLAALVGLQRGLLGAGAPEAALADAARLLADLPAPEDPGLAAALGAIALRCRIELARHGKGG